MIEVWWDVKPTSFDIFGFHFKLKSEKKTNKDMIEDM